MFCVQRIEFQWLINWKFLLNYWIFLTCLEFLIAISFNIITEQKLFLQFIKQTAYSYKNDVIEHVATKFEFYFTLSNKNFIQKIVLQCKGNHNNKSFALRTELTLIEIWDCFYIMYLKFKKIYICFNIFFLRSK